MIEPINRVALEEVLRHVLGQDGLDDAIELYKVVSIATSKAYSMGALETMQAMQPVVEEAINAGQDAGYAAGHHEGWAEGYVDGVARARTAPDVADAVIQGIIELEGSAKAVSEDVIEVPAPEWYEGDSGDECRCVICDKTDENRPPLCAICE